ncbi:unnamed protein product [Prunus armeniaca]|uniref:Uncharacterized protein n=1 Tax=Prunus armeniaca TaxID=36596 RepID=A0A6J5VSQ4_PRUAR|nr:unnamed protein product [Prunus armeniaca]
MDWYDLGGSNREGSVRLEQQQFSKSSCQNISWWFNDECQGYLEATTNLVTLQKENEDLRAQLRSVLTASHGHTSTSSRGSNGVHSDDDYYDELAN